ncbi:MAG: hypothetical protein HZA01_13990 [Nitrospinae bacterium]|nr:hypothetical protein [Nitrospinota bacterium]
MTIQQQLIKEIEGLPLEAQKKVLKLMHFVKEEFFPPQEKRAMAKGANALADIDKFAIETGIPDLSVQHDHYLYGAPKR